MITYVDCDLFLSPARVLVNTVNTVGVMGKGLAKDFKAIYPEMFQEYQDLCERGLFDIGRLWLYRSPNKSVLNFPTKRHWRNPSKPEYIEDGLRKFADAYSVYGITSISFPRLGCGNGELDWERQVRPLMERYLNKLPVSIYVHVPSWTRAVTPEHTDIDAVRQWLRSEPQSLAFGELWDDLQKMSSTIVMEHSQESLRIRVDNAVMTIEREQGHLAFQKESLLDLWQQLRLSGFVSAESMPHELEEHSEYVIAVLGSLPYIKPVGMRTVGGRGKGLGLRLAPRVGTAQVVGPTRVEASVVQVR